MKDCKSLLVLRTNQHLSKAQIESLTDLITPTADTLGAEPMVLGSGYDAELKTDTSAILSRIAEALEALVRQGEPPTVSEAEITPQSLNARVTGLNSRTPNYQPPTQPYGSTGVGGILKKEKPRG